ncbi:MAG: hypothetical protein E6767_05365 [Dysgonomonas sp.]|nr:hypothetical protein [Dysgonomonas sp.]
MKRLSLYIFGLLGLFSFPALFAQTAGDGDIIQSNPQNSYEERKAEFLNYQIAEGPKDTRLGIFRQLSKIELGQPVEEHYIQVAIDDIRSNRDCNDFTMNGMVRLMYMHKKEKLLSSAIEKKVEVCFLDFKYWWDDGRRDTTYRCYHTENHQGLYHTAELLAGQLYKDKVFTNGMTGRDKMKHATERLEKWMDYRFKFGFSEWLSSYYDVDIMLLANLYDFAENPKIRQRAGILLDLLFFDLALNNYKGVLPTTSGRIYTSSLINDYHDMSPILKLVFGEGRYLPKSSIMSNVTLCTSTYKCPDVILDIANDNSKTFVNRQRVSLNVYDAPKYGISFNNELNTHLFWGMQEFIHPEVIRMSKKISEDNDTWPYRDYDKYITIYENQKKKLGKVITPNLDRFALSEANIITYKTPDYIISSVQDYRKGATGYQQHIWQMAIDNEATVFTSHPGSTNLGVSPNYWAGNACMPRVAQHKNVVICIYNVPEKVGMNFTHAYFPKYAFDKVVEKGRWIFGKKGNGYIAIYSQNETSWKTNEKNITNDLIANGRQNIWICETGSLKESGTFSDFINSINGAEIKIHDLDIIYNSPSVGKVKFGWESNFKVGEKNIPLQNEYRYQNPYCRAKFDAKEIIIKKGEKNLKLNYEKLIRLNENTDRKQIGY